MFENVEQITQLYCTTMCFEPHISNLNIKQKNDDGMLVSWTSTVLDKKEGQSKKQNITQ